MHGDGEGQVGAEAAFEQRFERGVEDAGPADDGGEEGIAIGAVDFARQRPGDVEPAEHHRRQVDANEQAEQPRQQVERQVAFLVEGLVGVRNLAVHGLGVMASRVLAREPS